MKVTHKYQLMPAAMGNLQYFNARVQRIIVDGLRTHLVENDPEGETWHKGALKNPIGEITHKVDLESWRAYYKVDREATVVTSTVYVIGEKQGNKLFVEGEEFQT